MFPYVQFMSVHAYWSRSCTYMYLWLPLLSIELFPYIHTVSRSVCDVRFDCYLEQFNCIHACSTELIRQSDRLKATSRHACGGRGEAIHYVHITYYVYIYGQTMYMMETKLYSLITLFDHLQFSRIILWMSIEWQTMTGAHISWN